MSKERMHDQKGLSIDITKLIRIEEIMHTFTIFQKEAVLLTIYALFIIPYTCVWMILTLTIFSFCKSIIVEYHSLYL